MEARLGKESSWNSLTDLSSPNAKENACSSLGWNISEIALPTGPQKERSRLPVANEMSERPSWLGADLELLSLLERAILGQGAGPEHPQYCWGGRARETRREGKREKYQLPLVPVTPPSSLSQNGVREQELDALRYYTRVAPTQPAMQNTWQ